MKLSPLVIAAFIAVGTGASAQSLQDRYGFVFGGVTFEGQSDFDGVITPPGGLQSVDTDYDSGFNFGIGVGATIAPSVRAEVELSYTQSDADQIFFSGNGSAAEVNVDGGIRATTLFANALYDFDTGGPFTPYLGAGLGAAFIEQDLVYGPGVAVNEDDTVFAAQLIAGASYDLSDALALTADLRYRRFFDVESNRFNPAGVSTGIVSGDYNDLSLNVGLRFRF
ncbi:outer membrane protein [Gymnodinialimonas hymeniacidonis]|uniref:outer membrane protein n=1 Tax=Gymnodinialimonas hymeniacidonis TaxID=3126508 RepID=UPI0034C5B243